MKAAPWLAIAMLTAVARAQLPDPEQLRTSLATSQRDLQQLRSDAEHLLDLRFRHDLGLPVDANDELFRSEQPATTPQLERAQKQLEDEERSTQQLLIRYQKLRSAADQRQVEAERRQQLHQKDEEWIMVPAPGAAMSQPRPPAAASESEQNAATAAAPTAEGTMPRVVANLDPIKAQIDGSMDHSRVARSLFKAGQSLMDRADALRGQGQSAVADQFDDAARERLQRALDELRDVAGAPDAPFVDLLYLGKCRELLFRIAERRDGMSLNKDTKEYQRREQEVRDPLLAITARDIVVKNGNELLGPWGRAAQAAMEHFRWMNLHGGFQPKTALATITWPGQSDR